MPLFKNIIGQIEQTLQKVEIVNFLKNNDSEEIPLTEEEEERRIKRENMKQFIQANKF